MSRQDCCISASILRRSCIKESQSTSPSIWVRPTIPLTLLLHSLSSTLVTALQGLIISETRVHQLLLLLPPSSLLDNSACNQHHTLPDPSGCTSRTRSSRILFQLAPLYIPEITPKLSGNRLPVSQIDNPPTSLSLPPHNLLLPTQFSSITQSLLFATWCSRLPFAPYHSTNSPPFSLLIHIDF